MRTLLGLVLAGTLMTFGVWGTPAGAAEPALKATLESRFIPDSDVNDVSGGIEIVESSAALTYDWELENGLPLTLSFEYQNFAIDEDIPLTLPDNLQAYIFGGSAKFALPFTERDDLFMGIDVFPSMYTEDGEWTSSAFRIPFRTYAIYKPDETFLAVVGISVRIDFDTEVLPVLGFRYKPNDRLTFDFATDHPQILYQVDDRTTAFVEFGFHNDEFEVTRGSSKNVVLKYQSGSSGVGLRYSMADRLEASVSVGAVFGRHLEYRDNSAEADPDASVYVKGNLSYQF